MLSPWTVSIMGYLGDLMNKRQRDVSDDREIVTGFHPYIKKELNEKNVLTDLELYER